MSTAGSLAASGKTGAKHFRAWLLRSILFGALIGGSLGGIAALGRYLWVVIPPPAYELHISRDMLPRPGDPPLYVRSRHVFVVHLAAGEGTPHPLPLRSLSYRDGSLPAQRAGYLVLWDKSPFMGCSIAWRPDFDFEGTTGWFRDPCHSATFSRAGYHVFGPTPRPMDTFPTRIERDGTLVVDTRRATPGGPNNAQRIATPTFNPGTGR